MHSYVAVWQQPVEAGENSGTDGQRQFYFLGALGRRRCRKRTPGPPPLSSMNSTPAASKARRKVKSLATRRFSDFRFNYSVLGDTVNIASRLGSPHEGSILSSAREPTKRKRKNSRRWRATRIQVKGKTEPETAFTVLGRAELSQEPKFSGIARPYRQDFGYYRGKIGR